LYEEANAKQDAINSLNSIIATKDGHLQRFVKTSGSLLKHPKEDILNRDIMDAYNKIQALQDEKIAFVQKACALLDRYVKRLDVKIRDLQAEGSMPLDNRMPSLLRHSEGNLVAISSNQSTGTSTPNPLQQVSANAGAGSFNLAQQAMNRLHQAAAASATGATARSASATATIHPLHQTTTASSVSAAGTPASVVTGNIARTREMSVGSDPKKRRLNLGPLPPPNLTGTRHASLGPGTPKASTPGGSRAGSVGPRPGALKKSTTGPRKPLVQTLSRKKLGKKKPPGPRRLIAGSRASPATTTGDELSAEGESGSEDELASQDGAKPTRPKRTTKMHHTGDGDEDVEMEEAADDTKYCYCQDVSHGDMIACDNADCAIQWFHWTCAGITSEPTGEWLCNDCRKLPRDKIKKQ
jgi:inhibitor of growth protein 3